MQLLHKLKIRSSDGGDILLRVIKNPVTDYLPAGAKRIVASRSAEKFVDLDDYVTELTPDDEPVVFVIGSFAKGEVEVDYADESVAFSRYPLSGALACAKVCGAFERHWGIL